MYTRWVSFGYMSKISLSITKELLASLDSYCEQFKYERSEAIRQSIRNTIYPKDIPNPPPKEENLKNITESPNNTHLGENSENINKAPSESTIVDEEGILDGEGFLKVGNPVDFDRMKIYKKWCALNTGHPFEAGKEYDTYCFTGEDENGNPIKNRGKLLQNVFACKECIELLSCPSVMTGEPTEL